MVALLLRLVLLMLAALALGWAAWWIHRGQPIVGVAGALALLLVHTAVLAVEFAIVPLANRADPAPRAGVRELVSAWWNESRLGLRVFAWQMPFRSHAHADHISTETRGRRGVLLVHGFMCNRGVWNTWLARLRARGVAFIAPSLEPAFGSIDAYVGAIDDGVRRLRDATGVAPVIVAHSMGGLAVRAWLVRASEFEAKDHVPRDVHTIVTIASPHQGTLFGHRGPIINVGQMRRGNAWLAALARTEAPALRPRFVCFYSHCDNIVLPASTATLEGADNRHLRAMAHVQLVEQPAVFDAVVEALER
jgi:triacylglycerol lipase